jgi:hypothetical protein
LRVRHHDRAGRKMPWNCLDVDLLAVMRAMGILQQTVEFIGEAQKGITALKVNIYRIFKRLDLHITGRNRTKPVSVCRKGDKRDELTREAPFQY